MKILLSIKSCVLFCIAGLFRPLGGMESPSASPIKNEALEAFYQAVHAGELQVIVGLAQRNKTLITFHDNHGNSWLHAAAMKGYAHLVGWFAAQAPDLINETNDLGQTPLHLAALHGKDRLIFLFKGLHAGIDARDMNGATPMHLATAGDHLQTMQALLTNGASLVARDAHGDMPLHAAASADHENLISWLISNKAPLDAQNTMGQTAVFLAASQGNNKVIEALLHHGAKVRDEHEERTVLHAAVAGGHEDTVKLLLARGLEPDETDSQGQTPLMVAHELENPNMCRILREWISRNRPGSAGVEPPPAGEKVAVSPTPTALPAQRSLEQALPRHEPEPRPLVLPVARRPSVLSRTSAGIIIIVVIAYVLGRSGYLGSIVRF